MLPSPYCYYHDISIPVGDIFDGKQGVQCCTSYIVLVIVYRERSLCILFSLVYDCLFVVSFFPIKMSYGTKLSSIVCFIFSTVRFTCLRDVSPNIPAHSRELTGTFVVKSNRIDYSQLYHRRKTRRNTSLYYIRSFRRKIRVQLLAVNLLHVPLLFCTLA